MVCLYHKRRQNGIIDMLTALLVLLIVGFLMWRMVAHPIHSGKIIGALLGLILLGIIGTGIFIMGIAWLSGL